MIGFNQLYRLPTRINENEEKINLLKSINTVLKERHDIEEQYSSMSKELERLKQLEQKEKEKYEQERKTELINLERQGKELAKDVEQVLQHIELIERHRERCGRYRQGSTVTLPATPSSISKRNSPGSSSSSWSAASIQTTKQPSQMANLKNTSERLVANIIDLRKKIHSVDEKLDFEIMRKRELEKKMCDIRKDIALNKKKLSVRRSTPSLPPLKKSLTLK